jgi:hypothetical protein
MEEIGLGHEPNSGRFCGRCYARLGAKQNCEVCGTATEGARPVTSVPAEVVALYMAKRKREGLLVNAFAFFGIFVSMVISGLLWFLLPSGWLDILPFAMLVLGSYYLARLFGFWIGATLGYNSGRALRDRRWSQFVARRDLAATGAAAPSLEPGNSGSAHHE